MSEGRRRDEPLLPGLGDPVFDSQRIFRAALEAFSHPGRAVHVQTPISAPAPLAAGSAAFLLALADYETPMWLQEPNDELCAYLRLHCGAQFVDEPHDARFALVTHASTMPPLAAFNPGEAEYPDRSATVLIQVHRADRGSTVGLSGPGIRGASMLELGGLPGDFWAQWRRNERLFPRGVDVLFACDRTLFAVPRTTRAEV